MAVVSAVPLRVCDFSDPLIATQNGRGMVLVDSVAGLTENSRTICLRAESSRTSCSARAAEVLITDVRHSGQVFAQWRNGDPQTVDVFVFGGKVERCRSPSRQGGVRIVLRKLPTSRMPSPDVWYVDSTPLLFEGQPNRCAG